MLLLRILESFCVCVIELWEKDIPIVSPPDAPGMLRDRDEPVGIQKGNGFIGQCFPLVGLFAGLDVHLLDVLDRGGAVGGIPLFLGNALHLRFAPGEFLLRDLDQFLGRVGNRLVPQSIHDEVAAQRFVRDGGNLSLFTSHNVRFQGLDIGVQSVGQLPVRLLRPPANQRVVAVTLFVPVLQLSLQLPGAGQHDCSCGRIKIGVLTRLRQPLSDGHGGLACIVQFPRRGLRVDRFDREPPLFDLDHRLGKGQPHFRLLVPLPLLFSMQAPVRDPLPEQVIVHASWDAEPVKVDLFQLRVPLVIEDRKFTAGGG